MSILDKAIQDLIIGLALIASMISFSMSATYSAATARKVHDQMYQMENIGDAASTGNSVSAYGPAPETPLVIGEPEDPEEDEQLYHQRL